MRRRRQQEQANNHRHAAFAITHADIELIIMIMENIFNAIY